MTNVVEINNLSKDYGRIGALNNINLHVPQGTIYGLVGPNGAGKTTMMDVITGKTRPDAGTVFFGQTIDLTRLSEAQIAHAGIGRKFQKPTIFESHTVFENLELAMKVEPNQAGEFGVICNEFCGIGHHTMVGKIYVVE